MNKYTTKVERALANSPALRKNLGLEEFLTLTDDQIRIIEVEMTMDGHLVRVWVEVWEQWYLNKRV